MKKLLIIPMAVIEIVLLILNWVVALINPNIGEQMIRWNLKMLPNKNWYLKGKGNG